MPPRAPAHDGMLVVDDSDHGAASPTRGADTTTTNENQHVKSTMRTRTVGSQWNTFHWELNLYTIIALAVIYYGLLPVECRVWMHYALAVMAVDAGRYYYLRGNMAGVPYTAPLVSALAMLIHPVRFWGEMANIAMANNGMCSNTLLGKFLVFVTDPNKCRRVMTGEGTYGVYAHPNAYFLFGPKNLIYLPEFPHKRFRAILTPALFSKEALIQYAETQERVVRKFMNRYAEEGKATGHPLDARLACRSMAAASSQESFLGPYLNDELRAHLKQDIVTFTMGFLSFPFPYAGGLRRAIAAKRRIEQTIRDIVPKARSYIQEGHAPRCLMEHWSVAILAAAKEQGCDPQEVPCCHDDDMARTVLDFLFAAQDATNSALTYALDVLAAHPDVLLKMRREVEEECGVRDTNTAKLVIPKVWDKTRDAKCLPYCSKVAIELLHNHPPVPMIPHITKKSTALGGHGLPSGAVVIPSITYSARVSGASMEFNPDRADPDNLFVKTVTFGGGQHKCPGRRYAESLLTVFVALLSTHYDFKRTGRRPTMDEFMYFPTMFPIDCDFVITPRGYCPNEEGADGISSSTTNGKATAASE